jgi:hypothetical protein
MCGKLGTLSGPVHIHEAPASRTPNCATQGARSTAGLPTVRGSKKISSGVTWIGQGTTGKDNLRPLFSPYRQNAKQM